MKIGDKLKEARLNKNMTQVKSNKKLIGIIILALITMVIIALFTEFMPERLNMVAIFVLSIILTGLIYSEIIKRF